MRVIFLQEALGCKNRKKDSKDSSELVIHSVVTQMLKTTQPFIVGRSEDDISHLIRGEALEVHQGHIVLSGKSPEEYYSLRSDHSKDVQATSVEWVRDLDYRGSKIYVYKSLDNERPHIDGINFDFTVSMKLSFRYPQVSHNGYETELLTSGRFQVFAHLILEPEEGEQPILLTPGVYPLEEDIKRDNTLQLDYKVVVPYYPSMGNIKLVLKVIPLGMEYSLKPMDRRFTVGPYNIPFRSWGRSIRR